MGDFDSLKISQSDYVKRYEIGRQLGMGAFGHVVLAKNRYDGNEYAIKFTRYRGKEKEERERDILLSLKHENVVKFYGFSILNDNYSGKYCFKIRII